MQLRIGPRPQLGASYDTMSVCPRLPPCLHHHHRHSQASMTFILHNSHWGSIDKLLELINAKFNVQGRHLGGLYERSSYFLTLNSPLAVKSLLTVASAACNTIRRQAAKFAALSLTVPITPRQLALHNSTALSPVSPGNQSCVLASTFPLSAVLDPSLAAAFYKAA
jgi:hypothetical protein